MGSFQCKPILWYVAHTSFCCATEDRTFRIKDLVSRVALTRRSPARMAGPSNKVIVIGMTGVALSSRNVSS